MLDPVGFIVRSLAPDAGQGAFNDWQLVATSTWSRPTLIFVGVLLLVLVVVSSLGLRRLFPRRRLVLIGLRLLVAAWVLVLLLKPAVELRAVSRVRTRVAVLVDISKSMSLATQGGTRAEVALKHIQDHAGRWNEVRRQAHVEFSMFGERSYHVEQLPDPLVVQEPKTDLARALNEVSWQSSGRELGAVVVYSDGADTEGLTAGMAKRKAAALGVPIYTIGFSRETSAPDLAVRRVVADEFAFVHNTVKLDAVLEQRGLSAPSVMVTLKRDGTVLQNKEAFFTDGRSRVTFEFKPRHIGKQVYQVSVPVQAGENVDGNNEKSIVLKVIRDRIRVLQVAGRPSWDERFLREFLKRNPNVDLISFFILRSTTDLQKAPQEELALIPFPVNDLFTTELNSFDVVIYQNFSYRPYRMAHYLRNVRDYVLRGGSFLMIGGDNSFEDGWYAGTPIAEVLPVTLGGATPWDASEFRPRLTKEGRRHPITRIGEPGEPPHAVYRRLPPLAGMNVSLGLMPGAQALLVHPGLPQNPPVVSVREVGAGRTMAVTSDSLWFWRFRAVAEGGAGREFDRFWSNGLRWLIRDPELARVRLRVERSVHLKGDPVSAEVRVFGPDYEGLVGAEVTVTLSGIDAAQDEKPLLRELKTQEGGKAVVVFDGVEPGTYMMRAEATGGGERIGHAEEPVIVEAADVEFQAPLPRPEVLEALAEGSDGAYVDVSRSLPRFRIRDARRIEVDRTRRIPIWDGFTAFFVLLALAGFEWWIRRRFGLL